MLPQDARRITSKFVVLETIANMKRGVYLWKGNCTLSRGREHDVATMLQVTVCEQFTLRGGATVRITELIA